MTTKIDRKLLEADLFDGIWVRNSSGYEYYVGSLDSEEDTLELKRVADKGITIEIDADYFFKEFTKK